MGQNFWTDSRISTAFGIDTDWSPIPKMIGIRDQEEIIRIRIHKKKDFRLGEQIDRPLVI